ncbi:MAG: hypothetical protein J1E57_06625 [Prevotella sp.]|nr:hypothetical protein [Prevotella sp.]
MNRTLLIALITGVAVFYSSEAFAQTTVSKNDSITTAIRLNGLQTRKEKLQKEIKLQDEKRNSQITGVSPETIEEMNNRQDSICLALRSELVDVILEIKKISQDVSSTQLLQQYHNLLNKKEQAPEKKEE